MTLDLASSSKKKYRVKNGDFLCFALATAAAWIAGCASALQEKNTSIDNPELDGSTPGARRILPPTGSNSAKLQ